MVEGIKGSAILGCEVERGSWARRFGGEVAFGQC